MWKRQSYKLVCRIGQQSNKAIRSMCFSQAVFLLRFQDPKFNSVGTEIQIPLVLAC